MKTRKILAALTSLIMASMCLTPFASYAEDSAENESAAFSSEEIQSICEDDEFNDCFNVLKNNSDMMGISGDMTSAYIGTPFFMNYIDSDYVLTENQNNLYFPVITADDVCAFIIATQNNGNISYSCGKFFADVFDETGIIGDISLIFDRNENVYVIDESKNAVVIAEYYDAIDITEEMLENSDLATTSICKTMIPSCDVSAIDSPSPASANIIMDYQLDGYRSYVQSGANCWAYAILSMANYKMGTSMIEQVYGAYYQGNGSSYVYNNGATLTQAYNTIVSLFSGYSPVLHSSGVLSGSDIASTIADDLPSYIRGTSSAGNGHAVALMGYRMDSSYLIPGNVSGIFTMNPQDGAINYNSYSPYGCSFSGTSTTYVWSGSVTLQ